MSSFSCRPIPCGGRSTARRHSAAQTDDQQIDARDDDAHSVQQLGRGFCRDGSMGCLSIAALKRPRASTVSPAATAVVEAVDAGV